MASKAAENISLELQRAELEAVLRSELFSRAPTLAHLLSYLCEKTFAGESGQIKEYSIAVDVFGRRDSFDQDVDSIVRVQANRLRKRLAEYYAAEGATHRVQICVPVGQYVPQFEEKPYLRQWWFRPRRRNRVWRRKLHGVRSGSCSRSSHSCWLGRRSRIWSGNKS